MTIKTNSKSGEKDHDRSEMDDLVIFVRNHGKYSFIKILVLPIRDAKRSQQSGCLLFPEENEHP